MVQDEQGFETPKIAIAGVGGAGCNTINRMAKLGGVGGAEMIAINTDKKHLNVTTDKAKRILIGAGLTKGLGAGGYPEVAAKAAEMSRGELEAALAGVNLLFITAGMGGGTGTGAAPVIAEMAKKQGAIVVSMVTYPFNIERARLQKAKAGLAALLKVSDTVVVIDNNRLVEFVPNLPIETAFMVADEIVSRAVKGITETIALPSLMNIDFADMKTIMGGGGISMIAVGEAGGYNKVEEVVKNTLENRLLDVDFAGSKGVLLHITGGSDLTLGDATEIGGLLTSKVAADANVIWGARANPGYDGKVEVIAIFTGVKSPY